MLTKYNRRTVSVSSGAVIGGAFVRFYNQNTGAPVTAYNDAAGTSPIGTIVTSGTNGEVEVFLPPGLYRITVAVGSDIVEEITHEPITSNAAIIEVKTPAIGIMGLDSPAGDSLIVTGSSGLSEFVGLDDFKSDLAFTTADVTEDSGFLYHTAQRVRDVTLFGLNLAVNAVISASDSILGALGKLQKQISDNLISLNAAISLKEPLIPPGTTSEFLRGDKTWSVPPGAGKIVTFSGGLEGTGAGGNNPDRCFFIADGNYIISSVKYAHGQSTTNVGSTGKLTRDVGSVASGAGDTVSSFILDAAANVVQSPSISNATLSQGDRLSLYTNSAVNSDLRNICISVSLTPITS